MGEEVIDAHIKESATTLGFLLPIMDKNDLVKTVVKEGVLPRKTFSMGHSPEKRFYFECQRIVPEFSFYKSDFFRKGQVSVPLRVPKKGVLNISLDENFTLHSCVQQHWQQHWHQQQ